MAEHSSRRSIFRQAALDRIASQERLDVLNDVTSARYWIALCVVLSLLASAIVWGIFGSLPVKVGGEGILIRGGEVVEVSSPVAGKIASISVSPGQSVTAGMEVARLSGEEVARDFDQCTRELSRKRVETDSSLRNLRRQLSSLRERERELLNLLRQGYVARKEIVAVRGEITSTEVQIVDQQQQLRALGTECEGLKARLEVDAPIRSTVAGSVLDITVRPGDTVQAGSQLLTVEPRGPLQATIFVPVRDGKRLRTLMSARVSPSHIRPEEHGYMLARVHSYSAFPATPEALQKVLRNEGMVQRLREQGPLYRVVLDLQEDTRSPSGFLWTGKGPSERIESGTVTKASIIVERRRPVSYVIPLVRQTLGMSGG